jgi:hypothetical protein
LPAVLRRAGRGVRLAAALPAEEVRLAGRFGDRSLFVLTEPLSLKKPFQIEQRGL